MGQLLKTQITLTLTLLASCFAQAASETTFGYFTKNPYTDQVEYLGLNARKLDVQIDTAEFSSAELLEAQRCQLSGPAMTVVVRSVSRFPKVDGQDVPFLSGGSRVADVECRQMEGFRALWIRIFNRKPL